ncbi:MAG: glycosyltransferase family 2 protein [Thermodesulfobacteriota bacterium]|nr:glycosyltransferase family 2 protein [Thermodesulfobacteriota bacterium]
MPNKMLPRDEAPMVEVIIVTWNKKKDVTRLLEQLKDINYPDDRLEIVVVDNNSSDGTVQAIESSYPAVQLIRNPENLGGAGGFNTGMRWALENRPDAEYMWLLDNDILVDKNALRALVDVMNTNPQAAICGSKIVNTDNHDEVIEVGAFIDYSFGEIRRNMPEWRELQDPTAVFEVDYVAACSLLARTSSVREVGIWHDEFFIYWDDMEWGARFNAFGYKVLATNASIVYHPTWAGRTADNTAVWRNYYRTRNSLWFFNNYCQGMKRRLLLSKMVLRFTALSVITCLQAHAALSRAILDGVGDFLSDSYGKKDVPLPPDDLEQYVLDKKCRNLGIFLPDNWYGEKARGFIRDLAERLPGMRVWAIVPEMDRDAWEGVCSEADITTYRISNGSIPWTDKLRLLASFGNTSWNLLLTGLQVPRMGAIRGRDIARVDFANGIVIAVEKMRSSALLRIPFLALVFLLRVLAFPPRKDPARLEKKR